MRQAIKSDGTDGTAALKAYLLAHGDEVLSQELYEFTPPISPPIVQHAEHIVDFGGLSWVPSGAVLTNPVKAGNILMAFLIYGGSVDPGISDTVGDAWTQIFFSPGGAGRGAIIVWQATAVGSPAGLQVTWDPSDSTNHHNAEFYVVEISGSYSGLTFGSTSGLTPSSTPATVSCTVGPNTFSTEIGAVLGGANWLIFMVSLAPNVYLVFIWTAPIGPPAPPGTIASASVTALILNSSAPSNFTDASSPLTYGGKVYLPAHIKNDGFKSKIGLDVDSLKLSWNFRGDEAMVTDPNTGATILTMLQGFRYGLWAGVWVKWRRVYMPTFGDCETLAAVSMFRGRIGPVTTDRLTAQITVNSITEAFNRKVPAQLIEANNRSGQIGPGLPPDLNNDPAHWTVFQCVAGEGGTVQKIVAQQTAPTAGQVYAPGTFDLGYLLFQASPLANFVAQVQHYEVIAGYNVFYLFKPLYVDPHAYALKFVAFVPVPKDQTVSGATGVELKPFPYVPLPEQAV